MRRKLTRISFTWTIPFFSQSLSISITVKKLNNFANIDSRDRILYCCYKLWNCLTFFSNRANKRQQKERKKEKTVPTMYTLFDFGATLLHVAQIWCWFHANSTIRWFCVCVCVCLRFIYKCFFLLLWCSVLIKMKLVSPSYVDVLLLLDFLTEESHWILIVNLSSNHADIFF